MRTVLVMASMSAVFIIGAGTPAKAGSWCAWYDPWTYNCGFNSYQQCYATAYGGAGGFCKPNVSAEAQPLTPNRHHKRRTQHPQQ